jgi:hypothetical protein
MRFQRSVAGAQNRREDNNRKEFEINNNADPVSDCTNNCGNVLKR